MYHITRAMLVPLLKLPTEPPAPPPGHHSGEFIRTFRACPAYLRYRLFFWTLYAVLWAFGVCVMSMALVLTLRWWALPLLVVLISLAVFKATVLYVSTRMDFEMRWYILTERSLRLREGVWIVRELTLTFANVQNVHVLQGPVERLFGFSNILVETAGGGSGQSEQRLNDPHRAVLRGIDNPAEVRDLILNLLRHYRTAGLGDSEERDPAARSGAIVAAPLSVELLVDVRDAARSLREALVG